MKIVVSDDLPESALDILRSEGWEIDARSGRKPEDLAKDLADADALIVRSATKVTKDLLAAAPKLRIIGRAGSGVDNIDMPAASGKGVLNTHGAIVNRLLWMQETYRLTSADRYRSLPGARPAAPGRLRYRSAAPSPTPRPMPLPMPI